MTNPPGRRATSSRRTKGNLFDLGFAETRIVVTGDDSDGAFAMSAPPIRMTHPSAFGPAACADALRR